MKELYLEFGEKYFTIDFTALDGFLFIDDSNREVSETTEHVNRGEDGNVISSYTDTKTMVNGKEINGVRYEVISGMLATVLEHTAGDDDDDLLGAKRALEKMPFAYKIAFNTLLEYKIIKEIKL
ncbi:MAG: hypothetical protein ACW98D_17180 [Promethearchaeota archaeon]|jgi:hypothetical protein